MSVALLDVNVLVALFDPDHVHHDLAHEWFAADGAAGWATCPITENGFVRVVTHHAYHPEPPRATVVIDRLRRFCDHRHHHFWADTVSFRDESIFVSEHLAGPRQLTDIYLLGLAKKMTGRLATFDRSISMTAIKGARSSHLTVIEP
jgi:toxin-antitoxin system PIN domain toxin